VRDAQPPDLPGAPAESPYVVAHQCARYAFAQHIVAGLRVIHFGCRADHGSEMLTWAAASVKTRDHLGADEPAVDAIVMYDAIESLADAPAALRFAFFAAPLLVASLANPAPHAPPERCNEWTLDRFEGELASAASAVRHRPLELRHYHQLPGSPLVAEGRCAYAACWIVVARAR
jgi:hypothetical protein